MNTPSLETERLILRRFTEDDTAAVFATSLTRKSTAFCPGSR